MPTVIFKGSELTSSMMINIYKFQKANGYINTDVKIKRNKIPWTVTSAYCVKPWKIVCFSKMNQVPLDFGFYSSVVYVCTVKGKKDVLVEKVNVTTTFINIQTTTQHSVSFLMIWRVSCKILNEKAIDGFSMLMLVWVLQR